MEKIIPKLAFTLLFILVLLLTLESKAQDSGDITNYYYYQGKPFYLKVSQNEIFIKISKDCTIDDLRYLSLKYPELVTGINNNYLIGYGFVKLINLFNQQDIISLTENLKKEKYIINATPVFYENDNSPKYILQNEIIVQFKPSFLKTEVRRFIKQQNLEIIRNINLSGGETFLLKINDNKSAFDKAKEVYLSGKVNYSEPNFLISNVLLSDPNDPQFPMQWALRNTGNNIPEGITGIPGCDMRVDSAWMFTQGLPQIIVAINDTGCDTTQTDLAGNFIPGSGFNLITNLPGGMCTTNRHGTNCAGIVSAIANNNILISGVAPNCKMIPVICIDSLGYTTGSSEVNSIIYSYQHGASIINNSWQAGSSSALDNAINDAANYGRNGKGTVVMFSSGNGNINIIGTQANHTKVITVGGISPCNQRKSPTSCDNETSWGASYGPNLSIVAPSVKIYTTNLFGGLWTFAGTSSSCPNAAGVAALILSVDTTLTWKELRERLFKSAEKVGNYVYNGAGPDSLWKWNNEMGYGKVNAYNAVRYAIQKRVFQHIPLGYTEQITGNYQINCSVSPFNMPIVSGETKLLWSKDSPIVTDSVVLTNTGGNNYTANIPSTGAGLYRYYLKTKDTDNKYYKAPYTAPYILYEFWARPDTVKPTITHIPRQNIIRGFWPDTIRATVKDNYGVDSVWVKWKKNSTGTIKTFRLNKYFDSIYVSTFNSTQNDLNINDTIYYKILAKDISISGNMDSTALYSFIVLSQYSIVIGNGSSGTSYYPFATTSTDARTDMLYKNSEIRGNGGTKGYITRAGFKIKTFSPCTIQNLYLKMQNSTDTNLTGYINTNWTTLFAGTVTISDTGWIYFNFTEPYLYDTAKNLIAEVCFSNPTPSSAINYVMGFNNTGGYKMWARTYPSGGCSITGGSANGGRASILLFFDLTIAVTNIITDKIIENYSLFQNYPNPFNPSTKIQFQIPNKGFVTLKIYDILGREVAQLINENKQAGRYLVDFNAQNMSTGVYFYKLTAGDFTEVKKMVLIK